MALFLDGRNHFYALPLKVNQEETITLAGQNVKLLEVYPLKNSATSQEVSIQIALPVEGDTTIILFTGEATQIVRNVIKPVLKNEFDEKANLSFVPRENANGA